MKQIVYITGEAGTGKTSRLMNLAADFAPRLVTTEQQRLLAMSVMHGARRRLERSFEEHERCRSLSREISTIDSFALALVNRWRVSLGIQRPLTITATHDDVFVERHSRTYASFSRVLVLALELLNRSDVQAFIRYTYPLFVTDEFQDCHGLKLDFVKTLSALTQTLLAADDFQLLDMGVANCPAAEWISELRRQDKVTYEYLTEQHRTSNQMILNAAHALRTEQPTSQQTIPVRFGTEPQIAFAILDRLVLGWYTPRWQGTCALISPSQGHALQKVLTSIDGQLRKRGRGPIHWNRQATQENEEKSLLSELGVGIAAEENDTPWNCASKITNADAAEVAIHTREFARLRGIQVIPHGLVVAMARKYLHTRRSFGVSLNRNVITTIHGAKNREFDHVVVLWPYDLPPSEEQHRRLLYNAITRARKDCIVFAAKKEAAVKGDRVLRLIGTAEPVFQKRK